MVEASETQKKPIRIVHVHNSANQGGLETIMLNLLQGMDKKRFEQHLVLWSAPGQLSGQFAEHAASCTYLKTPDGKIDRTAIMRALHVAKETDVVNVLGKRDKAGIVAKLLGKASVWGVHGTMSDSERNNPLTGRNQVKKLAKRLLADKIVCCTPRAYDDQVEVLGHPSDTVQVITNGVDTDVFTPNAAARKALRAQLEIPENAPVVVLAVRYDPGKGIDTMIQAMKILKEKANGSSAHLILCGRYMDKDNKVLMQMIADSGLKDVHLLGYQKDMPAIYAASDIVALPSHGEALPLTVLEGMATGCLPVTTAVGDLPRLLAPVDGKLVEVNNPESLAAGLQDVLAMSPEERSRIAKKGREHVIEHYGMDRMIREYEAMFEQIAETHKKTSGLSRFIRSHELRRR